MTRWVKRIALAAVGACILAGLPWAGDVEALRQRAMQGDAQAQWALARAYYDGRGVARDDAEALRWLERAAERGHGDARNYLGFVYSQGILGVSRDDAQAVRWWRQAAEQGHEWGQNNLGRMYEKGSGVPRDLVQAYFWFSLSEAQGNDEAAKNRNRIAAVMQREEIAQAIRLADEWRSEQRTR